jgi:hypothetical protein
MGKAAMCGVCVLLSGCSGASGSALNEPDAGRLSTVAPEASAPLEASSEAAEGRAAALADSGELEAGAGIADALSEATADAGGDVVDATPDTYVNFALDGGVCPWPNACSGTCTVVQGGMIQRNEGVTVCQYYGFLPDGAYAMPDNSTPEWTGSCVGTCTSM